MGGFLVNLGPSSRYNHPARIRPAKLLELFEAGKPNWPDTSDAEIEDRSKADWIVKSLALTQVLWFVVNLVGRWAQGLAVTTLELYTLGIVICGIVVFLAYWEKPFDVGVPVILQASDDFLSVGRAEVINRVSLDGALEDEPITLCATIGVTLLFGAVHVGDGNFHLASFAEQLIWGISSIGYTVMPVLLFVIVSYEVKLQRALFLLGSVFLHGSVGVYAACRLCMFVEMFVSLRAVPASVYQTPQWSQYFPSFG
jgi:hypothetical protein